MANRGDTIRILAVVLAALALAPAARAQVAAPRLVEEGDEVAPPAREEAPAPARSEPAHTGGGATTSRGESAPAAGAAAGPAAAAAAGAGPAAAAGAAAGTAAGTAAAAATAGASATPAQPPATTADLARRIVPVQTPYARLLALWAERRRADREADAARAQAAERALLAAKRELAIENLATLAAVEVRESARALASNLPAEAVAHAGVAVELAPNYPDAHLALSRARLAQDAGKPGPALAALAEAVGAAAREPHTLRAFWGDVASAGFAAIFAGALATVLLLAARRLRLFLHDFHHLPLLRGAAGVQSGFVALVVLATPLLLGLGPLAAAWFAVLAAWLYLARAERLVATAALLALAALPWGVAAVARSTAWTGTLAEQIHDVEQGALTDAEIAEVTARFAGAPAPAPLYAALGRHHKRRGNLDEALRLYALASAADDRAPEVQVNVGNVLFLKGDLEGAKAAYLAATDRAGTDLVVLGAAHYGLSKLYLRTSDMEKSAAAREKAEREAGEFLRRFGSDDDFSANRYLVDVPVPERKLRALAAADASPEALASWVRQRLAGPLPRGAWPAVPLGAIAFLWVFGLAGRKLGAAAACERCGGAACRRCDAGAGALCGQCVNVFVKKGVVDARDRLRKEAQVRRHERLRVAATRVLALVGGSAGHLWDGAPVRGALLLVGILFAAFVVWFWRGVMPPPQPSAWVLAGKLVVAAPVGLAVWALGIRDAFRRTD